MNDFKWVRPIISDKRKRKAWWVVLNAVIILVFVGILARLVIKNLDTLSELRTGLRVWPLLIAIPVSFLAEILGALAWGMIINKITTPLSMSQHIKAFIITFAGRRIPGGIWQFVGRITWYERLGVSKRITLFGSVLETLLILLSGMLMTLSLIFFLPGSTQKQVPLFIVGIILILFLMHPRIMGYVLNRMGQKERVEELKVKWILVWLLMYLPQWLVGGTILYFVLNGIHPVPLHLLPLCIGAFSLGGVAGMLVLVLPSGFGLSEATTILILSTQIPALVSFGGVILMRVLLTLIEFALAGLFFGLFGRKTLSKVSGQGDLVPQKNIVRGETERSQDS